MYATTRERGKVSIRKVVHDFEERNIFSSHLNSLNKISIVVTFQFSNNIDLVRVGNTGRLGTLKPFFDFA